MERIVETAKGPLSVDHLSICLFVVVSIGAVVVVPAFGFYIGWALFGMLYLASGLGITVGYHRPIAHRSVKCQKCVKVVLLVTGGWDNYHHGQQRDYRNGPRWYNVDHSKWLIYGLSRIGAAYGSWHRMAGVTRNRQVVD